MAKKELVALSESEPQLQVPQVGDTGVLVRDTYLTTGTLISEVADGASAVGFTLTTPAYVVSGAKAFSLTNDSTEIVSVDKDGSIATGGATLVSGNVVHKLGDAAGANKLSLTDSADVEVFSVDSNGEVQLTETERLKWGGGNFIDSSIDNLQIYGTRAVLFAHNSDATSGDVFSFVPGALGGRKLTASSGTQSFISATPNINQSGTAGYNGILVNVTETATGSGDKNLLELQVGGVSQVSIDNAGQLRLDKAQTYGATTGLMFGDGDTGFYEASDDTLYGKFANLVRWQWTGSVFKSNTSYGAQLNRSGATSTVPAVTFASDPDTGLGRAAADQLSLIAGGVEGIRVTEAAGAIVNDLTGVATLITGHTVATLPTPAVGMIARVTDASGPAIGSTVTGGGAAYALVNYNGAAWTVIGI